jgi:hypothetical protein
MGLHRFLAQCWPLRNTPMANGRESPARALFKQDIRVPDLPTVPADQPASAPTPLQTQWFVSTCVKEVGTAQDAPRHSPAW